ncbi:MAG: hypothetical protein L3J56_11680, partial [Bacteroidales bacterium]|nr:hypothetical protein [Bacteroidales bacterium]
KDKVIAVSDVSLDKDKDKDKDNMNLFCDYLKCKKEYKDIRVIVYKFKEVFKKDFQKILYSNVTLTKFLTEAIAKRKAYFAGLLVFVFTLISFALLYYGVPLGVVDIQSIFKVFFYIIAINTISILIGVIAYFSFILIFVIFSNKVKKEHRVFLVRLAVMAVIISVVFNFIADIMQIKNIILPICVIFLLLSYIFLKPILPLDTYHTSNRDVINNSINAILILLYIFVFVLTKL